MKKFDISTEEIESLIANHFGIRTNLVIPNVSWGFGIHECDLLIVSKAGYCTEVEIKVSAADLKKDLSKGHKHKSNKIKYLYFAIPSYLIKYVEFIPDNAGIFIITSKHRVFCIAKPVQNNSCRAITLQEQYEVARLGALRIWGLKNKCIDRKNQIKYLREKLSECEKEKGK
jgi:hypothetical protein